MVVIELVEVDEEVVGFVAVCIDVVVERVGVSVLVAVVLSADVADV